MGMAMVMEADRMGGPTGVAGQDGRPAVAAVEVGAPLECRQVLVVLETDECIYLYIAMWRRRGKGQLRKKTKTRDRACSDAVGDNIKRGWQIDKKLGVCRR